MDQPSADELPSFELPNPSKELGAGVISSEEVATQDGGINPEQATISMPVTTAQNDVSTAITDHPTAVAPPTIPLASQASTPPAVTAPLVADDADLIEKEWVLKAKEIVEKTKFDPFQQNKEMGRFKAEYLKKRYNKDIRAVEE